MTDTSNRCNCLSANSRTSSSEFLTHRCCKVPYCHDNFICERNYTILRKICNKIFKDYIRSKCREKYTLFDGGNSVNVRIHRSGSRDIESHLRNQPAAPNDHHKKQNKSKEKKIDKSDKEIKENQKISKKTRKRDDNKTDESDDGNATYGKGKQKQKAGRQKHNERNGVHDVDAKRSKIKKNRRYENESDESSNNNETNENERLSRRASRKDENRTKQLRKNELNNNSHDKKKKDKKSRVKDTEDAYDDFNKEERVSKEKNKKGGASKDKKAGLTSKAYQDNNKKERVADTEDKNSHIVHDLRKKVRDGEKFGFSDRSRKSKIFKHQYGKVIPSRSDEVKSSDFLRAEMEQRDFCKLCCQPKSNQCRTYACNSKMCTPNFCPRNVLTCFSEACKC